MTEDKIEEIDEIESEIRDVFSRRGFIQKLQYNENGTSHYLYKKNTKIHITVEELPDD